MGNYTPIAYLSTAFNCPLCGAYAQHYWSERIYGTMSGSRLDFDNLAGSQCGHCFNFTIWYKQKMIYPLTGNVEMANTDLPEIVKIDYNEAKSILNISPRGSAALLRLALQKLLTHIGEKGGNINNDISNLSKQGLPVEIQQALDSVRVIGNNAVHPGVIDLNDTPGIATALFGLVNVIADYFITQPKKIAEIYGALPKKDRDNIAKRDGLASAPPSE